MLDFVWANLSINSFVLVPILINIFIYFFLIQTFCTILFAQNPNRGTNNGSDSIGLFVCWSILIFELASGISDWYHFCSKLFPQSVTNGNNNNNYKSCTLTHQYFTCFLFCLLHWGQLSAASNCAPNSGLGDSVFFCSMIIMIIPNDPYAIPIRMINEK